MDNLEKILLIEDYQKLNLPHDNFLFLNFLEKKGVLRDEQNLTRCEYD